MVRLSVDIDLCYSPVEDREKTIKNIEDILKVIEREIYKVLPDAKIEKKYTQAEQAKNIVVFHEGIIVKIEINLVVRGAVFETAYIPLCAKAKEFFGSNITARCLSFADVYGGKICATLDRQHPRDWYDSWVLLENEGVTEEIRKAFLVYLLSSKRPMSEILNPLPKDQRVLFANELEGMNASIPSYTVLSAVRSRLVAILQKTMTDEERSFLLSFKLGEPEWFRSGVSQIERFPAVQWKLFNIKNMTAEKRKIAFNKLKQVLNI